MLEARLQLISLITGFLGFLYTGDIILGIVFGIIGLLFAVGWQFYRYLIYKKKLAKSNIAEIDTMDGVQFEYYLQTLFKSNGYKVQLTTTSGDFGADLILKKDDRTIVVQAKRYSKTVGIKAVQEVIAAVKVYKADEAWVVTNSSFTKAAMELAKANEVILINRDALIELINQKTDSNKQLDPIRIKRTIKSEIKVKCEKCGSSMMLRKGKKGVFLGCSQYPKCTFTKGE